MADFGVLIAQKLVEVTASEVIKKICKKWDLESKLKDLNRTVTTIEKVLVDAEAIRELSNEQQHFISELKDAVYDADDLFDELRTLAELNQLQRLTKRGRLYKKVRRFFSSKNQLGKAYKMYCDVKKIKEKLDGIAGSHRNYGFNVKNEPIVRRREETCSYVYANDIIGRDNDKKAIVDMLLNGDDFVAVTIVGVGGLGKTALAQLVFNDERVMKEFPDLRFWVCVSDQDGVTFNVKTILSKILEVVTRQKLDDSSALELVQQEFQETLRGKKYLLVLDDVWNEKHDEWLELKKFLILGQAGSRVVVTTRSTMTGKIIGENSEKHAYELQGLSEDDSWRLFKMSAFGNLTDEPENDHKFSEMGKKIVAKCHNIPLALKVVGSLLFGQDISKWRSFEDAGLAQIDIDDKGNSKIMSILKLSYYNLEPSFKYCFGYCAVFPKDYNIGKQRLIDLWIAQGYITPINDGQCVEDVAEEHFLILLRRCFFQDVQKNRYGEVVSVKIHDLMHDVALEVGREEFCVVTSSANTMGDKIHHVRYEEYTTTLKRPLESSKIRSFICQRRVHTNCVVIQFDKWMCLRVLDLSGDFEQLPGSIGKLLHLRYLNLSDNENLKVLSNEITKLHNLQTLLLAGCSSLRELPENFSKLVNLRHLDLGGCHKLSCMRSRMGKMTSLKVLPSFYVGHYYDTPGELKVLKALTGIRGRIWIDIGLFYEEEGVNERERVGGYLKGMKDLSEINIQFHYALRNPEAVLENLEPPSNVDVLAINDYKGKRIPKWGRAMDNWAFSLKQLVQITLHNFSNLEEMPVLSRLPYLKLLWLRGLDNLEYMEMDITRSDGGTKSSEEFFPSLVTLYIADSEKLKGWWKKSSGVDDCSSCSRSTLSFPCLSVLMIWNCYNLTSFPPCPKIERLELMGINKSLQVIVNTTEPMDDNTAGISQQQDLKLRKLKTSNVDLLKSLPINGLAHLNIQSQDVREIESNVSEVVASSMQTSLQTFTIEYCYKLEALPEWIGCLSSLKSLTIEYCDALKSLPQAMHKLTSLQTLLLDECEELEALPEWISCLSSLKSLSIGHCPALKTLPEAMQKLTSLQSLTIEYCGELGERCKEPDGEDRPKIQHIPNITISIHDPSHRRLMSDEDSE